MFLPCCILAESISPYAGVIHSASTCSSIVKHAEFIFSAQNTACKKIQQEWNKIMDMELFWDGVKAMILGMAMVYLFLIIMILVMRITSKLLAPFAKRFEPQKPAAPGKKVPAANADEKLAKAAVEAVKIFKQTGKSPVNVTLNGKAVSAEVTEGIKAAAPAPKAAAPAAAGENQIVSPLPGTIIRVTVAAGDTVAAGELLAVIEAMKMETEIRAEKAGTIVDVLVNAKDVVTADQPIIIIGA